MKPNEPYLKVWTDVYATIIVCTLLGTLISCIDYLHMVAYNTKNESLCVFYIILSFHTVNIFLLIFIYLFIYLFLVCVHQVKKKNIYKINLFLVFFLNLVFY